MNIKVVGCALPARRWTLIEILNDAPIDVSPADEVSCFKHLGTGPELIPKRISASHTN